jgi:ubiquinone biosynthesis protein
MERMLFKNIFVFILLASGLAQAEGQYYLNPSEKAVVALALKSVTSNPSEQIDLIKKIYSQIKKSESNSDKKIKVSTFPEFITTQKKPEIFESYKIQDVDTLTLFSQIHSVTYYSDNKSVQKQINAYMDKRFNLLKKTGAMIGLTAFDIALQSQSSNQDLKNFIVNYIEMKISEFTTQLNNVENPQALIIGKLLKAYFKNLPMEQKTEIVYQLSQIPINSTIMDVFLIMIQNSGPQIQKLIQIMGRSSTIPLDFQDVFQKLESQVKPVPWREVKLIVENEGLRTEDFIYFEKKPIGVGTMAQTHRIQFKNENGDKQSSVVRFLKPGIAELVEMDYLILKIIASDIDNDPEIKKYNLPSLSDLVEDLNKSVVEELDLIRTVQDQNRAQKIYTHSEYIKFNNQKNRLQFDVPKTYVIGKNRNLMIQELVFGSKPYKELQLYKDIYPDLYRVIAEKTAELWLSEAFFKTGFFHADLHQGNLLLSVTDSEIKVNLLDFGMTGSLQPEQQKSALLLGLGIEINHSQLIAKHLNLLSKTQIASPEFLKRIETRSREIQTHKIPVQSLSEWISWAMDQGLELNYEFLKLNRGLTAIEILLADAKSPLSFIDIVQDLSLKNKIYMADLLIKEKNLKTKNYPELMKLLKASKPAIQIKSCQGLFEY